MDKFVSIFPHQSKQRRVQAQNRLINQAVDVGILWTCIMPPRRNRVGTVCPIDKNISGRD